MYIIQYIYRHYIYICIIYIYIYSLDPKIKLQTKIFILNIPTLPALSHRCCKNNFLKKSCEYIHF